MKRQAGSAMVLVLVMTVAITSIIVAAGGLTENAINIVSLKQAELQARYSIDGTNLRNLSGVKAGTHSVTPAFVVVDTEPTADETPNAVLIDNKATLAGSVKATGSYRVREKTYYFTYVYGKRRTPKPSDYALFINTATTLSKTLTTGAAGANGDVWVNGGVTLSGTSNVVNGDLEAAGTVTSSSLSVTETNWPSAPSLPFVNPTRATYLGAANQQLSGNQTFPSYTFATAYRLIYVAGDLRLTGPISGTGTLYVTGRVYIDANTNYATSGSRMAVIAENGVEVASGVSTFVGYYYTTSTFRVLGTTTHTLTSGGAAAQSVQFDAPVAITHDSAVWTDETEGNRLKLPGYWP